MSNKSKSVFIQYGKVQNHNGKFLDIELKISGDMEIVLRSVIHIQSSVDGLVLNLENGQSSSNSIVGSYQGGRSQSRSQAATSYSNAVANGSEESNHINNNNNHNNVNGVSQDVRGGREKERSNGAQSNGVPNNGAQSRGTSRARSQSRNGRGENGDDRVMKPISRDGRSAFYAGTENENKIAYVCEIKLANGRVYDTHAAKAYCRDCKKRGCKYCIEKHLDINPDCKNHVITSLTDWFMYWGTDVQPERRDYEPQCITDNRTNNEKRVDWNNVVNDDEDENENKDQLEADLIKSINGGPIKAAVDRFEEKHDRPVDVTPGGPVMSTKSKSGDIMEPVHHMNTSQKGSGIPAGFEPVDSHLGYTPKKFKLVRNTAEPEAIYGVTGGKFVSRKGLVDTYENASMFVSEKAIQDMERLLA